MQIGQTLPQLCSGQQRAVDLDLSGQSLVQANKSLGWVNDKDATARTDSILRVKVQSVSALHAWLGRPNTAIGTVDRICIVGCDNSALNF